MILLRSSCPRCGGDLSLVHDLGESYYSCVQCGHIAYGDPTAAPAKSARSAASAVAKREGREPPRRRHKPAEAA